MSRASIAVREPLVLGASAPVLAAGGAALALAVAGAETALAGAQVSSWPLEAAALGAIAIAGVTVVLLASPFRAPFRARSHLLVLTLVLLALLLDELAQSGRNTAVHDDWGLAVVPLFLLVLATLRPPGEVLIGGLAACAVVAAVTLVLSPAVPATAPAVRVAIALTRVLPPALAAAALSRWTLRRLDRRLADAAAPDDAVRLSVQQETVARLEAAAVPLLRRTARAGAVTAEEADEARAIAAELRAALVADLARGWLAEAGFDVVDPDGYTERMTTEQRTALRTTMASLPLADVARPGRAEAVGQDLQAQLTLVLAVTGSPGRARLAPLVPLLRTTFPGATVTTTSGSVVVTADFTIAG